MPILTTEEIRERVDRGVDLLDEKVPDWRERIHGYHLDMTSCYTCVLGQLFDRGEFARSGFSIGRDELGLNDVVEFDELGHAVLRDEYYGFRIDRMGTYEALQAEWLRRLP